MSGMSHEEAFAAVYNDVNAYPTLHHVAEALGKTRKTVRNYSALLRRRTEAGEAVPALVWRGPLAQAPAYAKAAEAPEVTPRDHARVRAETLSVEVNNLILASNYPVINPEAMVVQSHIIMRYDRSAGRRIEVEGIPRTWLTDTLRVAPVKDPRGRRFIFAGAQNDTPVDLPFWENLSAYAEWLGAEIVVGPWTYETNWWDENNPSSRDYDPLLQQHLCFGQMEIGENFLFCGEMNTLPTAARPISDLTTYARGRWAVFPHAKLQLISVPALDPCEQAHQIMTSGAVTRPRVIPRKAGVKAIHHHVLGATLVEFDEDGDIFCRQLTADTDGSFYDLDILVKDGRVTGGHRVKAVTAGDVHVAKLNSRNALATFGYCPKTGRSRPDSLLAMLNPEELLIHDLHDHESRNHHHEGDVSHDYEMAVRGRESILGEITKAFNFLAGLDLPETKVTIVESNHDIALERYIREGRYRGDGVNFRIGLEMDAAYHDHRAAAVLALDLEMPLPSFSLLEWTLRRIGGTQMDGIAWIYDGKSKKIDGIEVGNHGFRGANGARGTVAGYARLGQKMTIGDKHSPSILDEVFGAGVMQLNHGYNKGPSGWAVSHVIQYQNGKRALLTMQEGKWRSFSAVNSK